MFYNIQRITYKCIGNVSNSDEEFVPKLLQQKIFRLIDTVVIREE
jgi:hypothetical protein